MSYKIGRGTIKEMTIKSNRSKNEVDLISIYASASYYEDIFSAHNSANITVNDGATVRASLPISGGEELTLNIGERDADRDIINKFVVFNIEGLRRTNIDLEQYTLCLVSPEQLLDGSMGVRASYHKPISEIVRDVVKEFYTPISGKELIEVETTKGIHHLIGTGLGPNAFIRQCIREAESEENPSSIYTFFETVEGYHFITLDKLYKEEPSYEYRYDKSLHHEGNPEGNPALIHNIRYINFENNVNLINSQVNGEFNSRTTSYDPLTKSFQTHGYNYDSDFTESKFVNRTLNREVSSRIFSNPTTSRFIITDSHRSAVDYVTERDPRTQQTFRRRQNFMDRERAVTQQYASTRLTLSIYGNPNIKAGQTIDITLPNMSDAVQEKQLNDRLLSGKYLVSAVAHNFTNAGEYATVLEVMRPGYQEKAV